MSLFKWALMLMFLPESRAIGLTNCQQIFTWYAKAKDSDTWVEKTNLFKPKALTSAEKKLIDIAYRAPPPEDGKLVSFALNKEDFFLKTQIFISDINKSLDAFREYYALNLVLNVTGTSQMVKCWEVQQGLIFGFTPWKKTLDDSESTNFTKEQKASIITQVIKILKDLHSKNIIYGNLMPKNVGCYDEQCAKVVLINFENASRTQEAKARGEVGYMPPEVFKYSDGVLQEQSLDIWGIGILILCLIKPSIMNFFGNAKTFNDKMHASFISHLKKQLSFKNGKVLNFLSTLLELLPESRLSLAKVEQSFTSLSLEIF